MATHLIQDLLMQRSALDISLFFKLVRGKLAGVSGTYVDDGIHTGNDEFLKECDKTEQKFTSRQRALDNFTFSGIEISTHKEGIRLCQRNYALSIKPLPSNCSYRHFTSCRQNCNG